MTIRELFDAYFLHLTEHFSVADTSIHNIDQTDSSNGYIIIQDLPDNPEYACKLLYPLFIQRKNGSSIFINNVTDDASEFERCFRMVFQENHADNYNKVNGVSIVHIKGVGYIITALHASSLFVVKEYSEDEYDRLSNEYIAVGMAKQELHYVKDWVGYHLHIGFDKVILFDNNDTGGESYNELLKEYVESGKLEIIDIRGQKAQQCNVYNSIYYYRPFKWCSYIDIDEFIWFNETGPYTNIKEFLDVVGDNGDAYGIMLQWHCYLGSGDDKPSEQHVWEVCNRPVDFNSRKDCRCEYMNDWCKSIYKRGYPLQFNEHFGWVTCDKISDKQLSEVSPYGKPIYKHWLTDIPEKDFNNQPVYVKHFLLRNINEFYHKKYLRGHAGSAGLEGLDGWGFWGWRQNMNYFTDITPSLTGKEQLFMAQKGMKINYTFHPDVFVKFTKIPGNDYLNNSISNIITKEVLPNTNAYVIETTIEVEGQQIVKQEYPEASIPELIGGDFYIRYQSNFTYFGINMNDESSQIRKFIQEPIIISIGSPLKWATTKLTKEEQDEYLSNIECILRWDNLKNIIRDILDKQYTIIPYINVHDNSNYFGWKDSLNEWFESKGKNLPSKYIDCDTFIMSYSNYQVYKQYQKEFIERYNWTPNKFIISNIKNGITTPYQAYLASAMSFINNPYYIWPS